MLVRQGMTIKNNHHAPLQYVPTLSSWLSISALLRTVNTLGTVRSLTGTLGNRRL